MSRLIYSYKLHENLTVYEKAVLNVIYFKSVTIRDYQGLDVFLKITLTCISLFSIIRMLVLAIKLKLRKSSSFIFTVTASLATFSIIVYASFIFWSYNNVFRTPSIPGSTECLSLSKLHLEKARAALYRLTSTANIWLTIFICALHSDCFKIKDFLLFLNEKSPSHNLYIYLILPIILSVLTALPQILTTEIAPTSRLIGSCYEWTFLQGYSISTLVVEMGPCLVMLGVIVKIKCELTIYRRKVLRRVGSTAMRRMCALYDSAQGRKKRALTLMLIMFVTTFPCSVRHFLILIGVYDTRDYYLDESLCDILDSLMLLNTSFPAAFCFNMKRRMDQIEAVISQSSSKSQRTSTLRIHIPKISLKLGDLRIMEKGYYKRAGVKYKSQEIPSPNIGSRQGSRWSFRTLMSRLSSLQRKSDFPPASQKLSTISQSDDVNSIKSIDLKDLVGERPKSADASISSGSNTNKVNMDGSF